MNTLNDVINYVRRIVKTSSNEAVQTNLIIDYINRFWLMDMSLRVELFDLKTKYQFLMTPGIVSYNMPLYQVQEEPGEQSIAPFPVYQGFLAPIIVNGIQVPFYTQRTLFYRNWTNYPQPVEQVATGDGNTQTFAFNISYNPLIPANVDITGIQATGAVLDPIFAADGNLIETIPVTSVTSQIFISYTSADGQNVVVADSGQFYSGGNDGHLRGLLMLKGLAPYGNQSLGSYAYNQNIVDYNDGFISVTFPEVPIQVQCFSIQQGIPTSSLYYNNQLTFLAPPDKAYLVETDCYLTPAAFLSTDQAVPFGYMAEYIARGAARKMLSDTGDVEQFAFYELLFREQENLVLRRSSRTKTSTPTPNIFNQGLGNINQSYTGFGGY